MQKSTRHVGGSESRPVMGETVQPGSGREWRATKGSQMLEDSMTRGQFYKDEQGIEFSWIEG